MEGKIVALVLHILSSSLCWAAFGLAIGATASTSWLEASALRSGLFTACAKVGDATICRDVNTTHTLNAVRAFMILTIIVSFFANLANLGSGFLKQRDIRRIAGAMFLTAGTFGIVACATFTANSTDDIQSGRAYYSSGFILGWISASFLIVGGLFAAISALHLPTSEE